MTFSLDAGHFSVYITYAYIGFRSVHSLLS